jgi:4-carboxymuconolactone decarboxylase
MPRLMPIDPDRMTPEQRRVHEAIAGGPRGSVPGPLAVWLHRPGLATQAQALGRYCRYETSLPTRLSELAILITGRIWGSEFEWYVHKPIALEAGVPAAVVEAIRTGAEPVFEHEDEAALHAFAVALHRERQVPDRVYERALAALGQDGVVDLVGLLGYYTLISMTINAFEVGLPEGVAPELDQGLSGTSGRRS